MRAEIAASARNEDLHNSIKGDIYLDSKRVKSIESRLDEQRYPLVLSAHFPPCLDVRTTDSKKLTFQNAAEGLDEVTPSLRLSGSAAVTLATSSPFGVQRLDDLCLIDLVADRVPDDHILLVRVLGSHRQAIT